LYVFSTRVANMGYRKEAGVADEGKVYRVTEVVGTSKDSMQQAVRNAVKRANDTLRNLDWFEVGEVRGTIENGEVGEFQVVVKIGFKLE
jgi:flavin-binding protein dodecin